MAFSSWYSTRRRYGSRYGRYSRRRYGSRRRRTFGNFKSALQQRDAATVVLNSLSSINVVLSTTSPFVGSNYINIWQALLQHPFFANYSGMYDQMHLDGVKAKITGVQQAQNANSYLTPTIITAWDRNGFDVSSDGSSALPPSATDITSYSSAVSKAWSLGNSFQINRSIYPSIMSEKSQYVSPLALLPLTSSSTANTPERNPVSPTRTPSVPFKPQLLIAITTPSALTTNTTFTFNVELDIQVTFRGLRKGPTA